MDYILSREPPCLRRGLQGREAEEKDCAATGTGEPVRAKVTSGDAVKVQDTGLPVSATRSAVKPAGGAGE